MDVNDTAPRKLDQPGELFRSNRAQAVRRDTNRAAGQGLHRFAARSHDVGKPIAAVDEAPLALLGLRASKTAVRVESWQQGQADSRAGGSGGESPGQLSRVCEWNAAAVMVQIVKLPHLRETAFEHFRIGERGNGFELIGIDPLDELVHELAPGPEAIAFRTTPLREPGDATLKRVAVQIGNSRNANL